MSGESKGAEHRLGDEANESEHVARPDLISEALAEWPAELELIPGPIRFLDRTHRFGG